MAVENLFIQRIDYTGPDQKTHSDIDLSFMAEVVYVETIDLSGPRLMLKFRDPEELYREVYGFTEGGQLSVTLSDAFGQDEINHIESFTILTLTADENDVLSINALSSVIHGLKQPAAQARYFVQRSNTSILQSLVAGVGIQAASCPLVEDYHLNPAARPSRLIRTMAREQGCHAFYRRGELVYKQLETLLQARPVYEYHYNDNRAPYQLFSYRKISPQTMIGDRMNRNYRGWHIEKGELLAQPGKSHAPESTGLTSKLTLDNMGKVSVPVLDLYMAGNGGLQAGASIELVWNRADLENPISENMPTKVVIGTVAHRYTAQQYHCRVKGVLPNQC